MNNGCFETLLASVPRLTGHQRQALLQALTAEAEEHGTGAGTAARFGDAGGLPWDGGAPMSLRGLDIDPQRHEVRVHGRAIELSRTQFRLLRFLAAHRHRVVTREEVIRAVWGARAYLEPRTVDAHVRRLRRALRPSGHDRLIRTVRGVGYQLDSTPFGEEAA
ncbi:winged helix-turn-helix domain-containing protein [Halorhodospira sp. 9621]|uniref:winged helix-turn-helix domain-containing protein n=1 Tax=Halorhodospira sp. 9621 TaxID=2899135 RepID=UPI001EE9993C|nr:winged helix-turn-helix domain-containing protein [Halorhodospira sp. 9621]MCG5533555.1 winged helix-turn-helix domain-containing protein [Halorhodospira sp. 9621]